MDSPEEPDRKSLRVEIAASNDRWVGFELRAWQTIRGRPEPNLGRFTRQRISEVLHADSIRSSEILAPGAFFRSGLRALGTEPSGIELFSNPDFTRYERLARLPLEGGRSRSRLRWLPALIQSNHL